jgi:hypothetical protein
MNVGTKCITVKTQLRIMLKLQHPLVGAREYGNHGAPSQGREDDRSRKPLLLYEGVQREGHDHVADPELALDHNAIYE